MHVQPDHNLCHVRATLWFSHLFDLPTPSFWLHFHDRQLTLWWLSQVTRSPPSTWYASKSRWKIMLMSKLPILGLHVHVCTTEMVINQFSHHLRVISPCFVVWKHDFLVVVKSQFLPIKCPCVLVKPHGYSGDVNRTSAVIHSYHSRDSAHQIGFTPHLLKMNYCDLAGQSHEKTAYWLWLAGGTTPKWFGIANTFWILLANTFTYHSSQNLFIWIWLDIFYDLTGQPSKICLVSMFWILGIKWIIWESWYVYMFPY